MIKTLIVDDSAIVREILREILINDSRFEIAGFAENGKKAVDFCKENSCDLIIMDINMNVMNGIDASKEILSFSNPAIVAFTTIEDSETAYKSLTAGVLEVINKPDFSVMTDEILDNFKEKFFQIAENHKNKKKYQLEKKVKNHLENILLNKNEKNTEYEILAIGASTGGPQAILTLLNSLNDNFPLPIVITQHIDKTFDDQMTQWLNTSSKIPVSIVKDYEKLEKGHAYVAPANFHFTIKKSKENEGQFIAVLDSSQPEHYLRPAVDKMFKSLALCAGDKTIAVILTGMGTDGTEGAVEIKKKNGLIIAESAEDCVVFGMPKSAIESKCVDAVLSLKFIGEFINKKVEKQ